MQQNSKSVNPFPGLRPFTMDESHLFFGREGQSETIVNYLSDYRFAAVTGASGSGKSSLIYCGVTPLLYGGFISQAGSDWEIIATRPGSRPIWNLAKALSKADSENNNTENSQEQKEFYYSLLNRYSLGLTDAIKQAFENKSSNVLLVIDQFEELFRYKENRESMDDQQDDPRAFIKLLVNIIKQTELPVYVVLTMRSDFVGDCSDFQDLTELINKSNYLVPQMKREDYEQVILGPIQVAGAEIEPRLLQELLNSIESNHDQLPVLQHVLMRTWSFWEKNNSGTAPISLRDYMAAGKLENALSLHANEAYNSLNDNDKRLIKIVFKSLTERGKEGKGIRRPVSVQDIADIAQVQPNEIIRVVDVFREPDRSFLTPNHSTQLAPNMVVDISHESLMRVWDKLKLWVDEESSSAQMYLRLVEMSGAYQAGKSGLMQSPDLQLAINWRKIQSPNRAWAKRYHPAYEKAMVYLNTSEKVFKQEEEKKVKIQQRELYRTRRIAILLGVVAVAFLGLMFFAYRQSQEAIAQKERAESYANLIEGEKDEALELSQRQRYELLRERERLDSLQKARQAQVLTSPEEEESYQELLAEVTRRTEELEVSAQQIEEEKQRSEQLAQSAQENVIEAERMSKVEYRKRMLTLSSAVAVKSTQQNNSQLAGLLSYQSYILNRENGGQANHPDIYKALYHSLRQLKGQRYNTLAGHESPINSLAFDAARNLLYSSDEDGTVMRWGFRRANPSPTVILESEINNTAIDLTSDGRWLASGSESGELRLVNTQALSQSPRVIEAHNGRVISVQFVPGRNAVITSGADRVIKYWDLLTNVGTPIITDNAGFNDIDASAKGDVVVCATNNGKLLVWNVATKQKELLYTHSTSIHAVAYGYEGEKIAFGDRSGNLFVLNAITGKVIRQLSAHSSRILDIEFSSDNRQLATSGLDGVMKIWNLDDLNDLPVEIREHESWVKSIAFSPDGNNLLSTSNDGNLIYIWPVKADRLADEVCEYVERQLSEAEWNSYIGADVPYRKVCE